MKPSTEVKAWLENYEGDFPFYLSLKNQLNARGVLSLKQIEAVERAISRESAPKRVFNPEDCRFKAGDVVEIKTWLAKKLAEQNDVVVFFRNLKIVEVHNATAKAMLVSVAFHSDVCTSCHVCGRTLTNDFSRATGIGPVCLERLGIEVENFDIEATIAQMEIYAKERGNFKIWLPFSQIK